MMKEIANPAAAMIASNNDHVEVDMPAQYYPKERAQGRREYLAHGVIADAFPPPLVGNNLRYYRPCGRVCHPVAQPVQEPHQYQQGQADGGKVKRGRDRKKQRPDDQDFPAPHLFDYAPVPRRPIRIPMIKTPETSPATPVEAWNVSTA